MALRNVGLFKILINLEHTEKLIFKLSENHKIISITRTQR